MRESSLWYWLKPAEKSLPLLHMCRVENIVIPGYPDVEGCLNGAGFWIELKVARGRRVDISEDQAMWLKRRWDVGGAAWVLLEYMGERWLVNGANARLLLEPLGKHPPGVIVHNPVGAVLAATGR